MKVFVYWNLHKKCFSVKALEGPDKGHVVDHVRYVELEDVTFQVSEAGRQRVLRTGRKNAHAGMVGRLTKSVAVGDLGVPHFEGKVENLISYNPRKGPQFVRQDGTKVLGAGKVRGYIGLVPVIHADMLTTQGGPS